MPKNVKSAIRGAARLRTVIFSALLAGGIAGPPAGALGRPDEGDSHQLQLPGLMRRALPAGQVRDFIGGQEHPAFLLLAGLTTARPR